MSSSTTNHAADEDNVTNRGLGTDDAMIYTVTPRRPLPQMYNLIPINVRSQKDKAVRRISESETRTFSAGATASSGSDIVTPEPNGFTLLKEPVCRSSSTEDGTTNTTRSFALLVLIFTSAIACLAFTYFCFPTVDPDERQYIKLPKNIDDAKNLGRVLSHYKESCYMEVLAGYVVAYIFLQSFAIPGSIFLSILSGFLFPFPLALFLVCFCSAAGASFCYLLADLVGRRLVCKYIPDRVAEWSSHVSRHSDHLLNYIIFLRITPFLPNWFINISSPVINVPLFPFFLGTFIGVAPPSFVAIQTGTTLQALTSSGAAVSWTSIAILGVFASVSLLPVLFKKSLRKKFD